MADFTAESVVDGGGVEAGSAPAHPKQSTAMFGRTVVPVATATTYVHRDRYLDAVCRANAAEAKVSRLEEQVEKLLRRLGEWPVEELPF